MLLSLFGHRSSLAVSRDKKVFFFCGQVNVSELQRVRDFSLNFTQHQLQTTFMLVSLTTLTFLMVHLF